MYCDTIPCLSFPAWSYAEPPRQVYNCLLQQIYRDAVPHVCFSEREVKLRLDVTLQFVVKCGIASFNVFMAMLSHSSVFPRVRLPCSCKQACHCLCQRISRDVVPSVRIVQPEVTLQLEVKCLEGCFNVVILMMSHSSAFSTMKPRCSFKATV